MKSSVQPVSRWIILAGATIVIAVLAVVGMRMIRPSVGVSPATRGLAVHAVPATIEAKADAIFEIKSELAGRVKASHLRLGAKVKRGELLLSLDPGDINLEIERIESEIVAARRKKEIGSSLRTDLVNAQQALENSLRLEKAGSYAPQEIERQRRAIQQIERSIELDEANLELDLAKLENELKRKQRDRSKMEITAPADGIVSSVLSREGDLISAETAVATMLAGDRRVEARVSEEYFALIEPGQRATVRFLTYGPVQFEAKVAEIIPAADPATQRYSVFLDVELTDGRTLAHGLSGEASIVIDQRANAIIVPRRALRGEHAYVVKDGRIERRKVERGFQSLNVVEILSGVAESEWVVIDGLDLVSDGARVRATPRES